jgi:DNA-binding GntR family transcriptional regulator
MLGRKVGVPAVFLTHAHIFPRFLGRNFVYTGYVVLCWKGHEMGQVVLGRRLRDQVYDLIRADLLRGVFDANERLYEVDLAAKYGVSRTPVREALFQLVREGAIVSKERGFSLPIDTAKTIADRIEVHLLIDPKVAAHAAANRNPEHIKIMSKAYARSIKAHESGNYSAYLDSVNTFRTTLREMCSNVLLRRCAMLIDDQYLAGRNDLFKVPKYRALDLAHNEKILSAIESGDSDTAETITRNCVLAVRELHVGVPADGVLMPEKQVKRPKQRRTAAKLASGA